MANNIADQHLNRWRGLKPLSAQLRMCLAVEWSNVTLARVGHSHFCVDLRRRRNKQMVRPKSIQLDLIQSNRVEAQPGVYVCAQRGEKRSQMGTWPADEHASDASCVTKYDLLASMHRCTDTRVFGEVGVL